MSSEVSETPLKKKKKKKKLPQNGKVVKDSFTEVEDDNHGRSSKKLKKKKNPKTQSQRLESSPEFDNENDMSQIVDDIDQDNAIEYDDDTNEHSNNHSTMTRKKKERKKKRTTHEIMEENENIHAHNTYEEEQTLPYSSSSMDSKVSSKKYNERVRNNGKPPPMRAESHDDYGHVEYDHDDYMSEMENIDHVDDYSQDYSEEDEEEPRFKYSTADLADGGFRDTKCCLIAAGIFFILIAIGMSIFMAKLNKSDDRRSLSPMQHLRGANLSSPF